MLKKPELLKLNIQFFAEGGGGDIDSFDMAAFDAQFEQESVEQTEETTETPVIEETDPGAEETPSDTVEEGTDGNSKPETPETPSPNADDEHKRNEAFANLRKEAEQNRKYAQLIQELAEANGISPEEVVSRYQESKLKKDAEAQNIPVDVLKRLNDLETENKTAKEQAFVQRLEAEIGAAAQKFGIAEENLESEVEATFTYAAERGIDLENSNVTFEEVYRLANLDTLTERAVKESQQKSLQDKKQRQQDAGIPNGVGNSQAQDDPLAGLASEAKSIVADW